MGYLERHQQPQPDQLPVFEQRSLTGAGPSTTMVALGAPAAQCLTNCSFLGNSAPTSSGGALGSVGPSNDGSSNPVLVNCVVWGNGGASTFTNGPGAFITTSYSLLEASATGYNAGTGTMTTSSSPFVSPTDARLNGC